MKKTALYQKHVDLGAKMVEFGGWLMPVQYAGVLKEHDAVRNRAGLFDVSHMGEFFVAGPGATAFIDRIVTNDVTTLAEGKILYSVMCKEDGGVIDDLLVYRLSTDRYMLVVNASNRDKDFAWVCTQKAGYDVTLEDRSDDTALLALQGPRAEEIFRKISDLPDDLCYYELCEVSHDGALMIVSRTGYTGEDGLEIYLPQEKVEAMWDALLKAGEAEGIAPAGLAVRDLLRIEAGYSLYGHELDESIDPLTAGLSWVVKRGDADFIGKSALADLKPSRRRIAFTMDGKVIPRQGYPLFVGDEREGDVTSGTLSPVLQKPVGIGYISGRGKKALAEGATLFVEVRGKKLPAAVCRAPFIKPGIKRRGHGSS